MAKMSPVVHFEMGYKDKNRMIKFYEVVFGWKTQQFGEEMGNYVVAHTAKTDKNGMIQRKGAINGGFYDKTEKTASQAPSVVIAVDDIKTSIKEIEKAGGEIVGVVTHTGKPTKEPQMIPGVGLWMVVKDTEGNRISILQPKGM